MQQRFRATFYKGDRVRYVSHLDVLRYWERAIRRAELPLAYSKGFTPHPRITFAGPLPMGFVGEGELMEFLLEERCAVDDVRKALAEQTSPEMELRGLREVAPGGPALQAALQWADYRVVLDCRERSEIEKAAADFLALESLEWVEQKKDRERTYDLRKGVASLSVEGDDEILVRMRLAANQDFTVRPEQVLEAVFPGAEPREFIRERLILDERSPAREAWRRKGQYLDERRR